MMTGTVIGYNSTGSSTSRLRARTSIAANSVPTAAKPDRAGDEDRRQPERVREQRRLEQQRHERHEHELRRRRAARRCPSELADVDRRARGGRQQQRAQRLRLPLALERAAERQRARKRDRDPQDARPRRPRAPALPARARTRRPARTRRRRTASCRRSRGCGPRPSGPSAAMSQTVRAQQRHELARRRHDARDTSRAARRAASTASTIRPSRRNSALVEQPFRQIEVVRGEDDDGAARRAAPRSRATQRRRRGVVQPGERLVEQHEPRVVDQRALERHALPHAAREARHRIVARGRRGPRARAPRRAAAVASATP